MPKKTPAGSETGGGFKHIALGGTFAGGILFFLGVGVIVDRWLGLTPLFTIVGTLVGSVLSFLNVYWKLTPDRHKESKETDR